MSDEHPTDADSVDAENDALGETDESLTREPDGETESDGEEAPPMSDPEPTDDLGSHSDAREVAPVRGSAPEDAESATLGSHDDDGLVECPLCAAGGYPHGRVPFNVAQSPRMQRCEECSGTGLVMTGSFVGEHAILPCERCIGTGFTTKAVPVNLGGSGSPVVGEVVYGKQYDFVTDTWIDV